MPFAVIKKIYYFERRTTCATKSFVAFVHFVTFVLKKMNNKRDMHRIIAIALTAAASGCASYTIPQPAGFTAGQTLSVEGGTGFKLNRMAVGDYAVQIDRSSTKERQDDGSVVRDRSKQQGYSFVVKQNDATVFTGGCNVETDTRSIAAPAGIEISARENSELECEILPGGRGSDSWRLELKGKPDNPLNGRFIGNGEYTIEGIGTAFGSTKHGPTGGYHIKQGDRTVATVQVTGKRQVTFASDAQSQPLLAAAIALLLIDENARKVF